MTVVMDEFKDTQATICADERGRITLGSIAKSKRYLVSCNDAGQLLLTPAVVMPEYEAWLWSNPAALASVRQGLAEAAEGSGEAVDFSQYADLEIED